MTREFKREHGQMNLKKKTLRRAFVNNKSTFSLPTLEWCLLSPSKLILEEKTEFVADFWCFHEQTGVDIRRQGH